VGLSLSFASGGLKHVRPGVLISTWKREETCVDNFSKVFDSLFESVWVTLFQYLFWEITQHVRQAVLRPEAHHRLRSCGHWLGHGRCVRGLGCGQDRPGDLRRVVTGAGRAGHMAAQGA